MKLGAIDIGSNAIRFQISTVLQYQGQISFKKVEYMRFPLRLGRDVFLTNKISDQNIKKLLKLMKAYAILLELYKVDDHMVCATSAMRECTNKNEVLQKVKKESGLTIRIIDGQEEAAMIDNSLKSHIGSQSLHIDVGGGSTELNLYKNKIKTASESFKIGSVRKLEKKDTPEDWKKMQNWVKKNVTSNLTDLIAIGTGGNINKIFGLAKKNPGQPLSVQKIREIQTYVASFSLEDRINGLKLNPDRADVIIPAADIYLSVMEWANVKKIIVPDLGLKDGIIKSLFEKNKGKVIIG